MKTRKLRISRVLALTVMALLISSVGLITQAKGTKASNEKVRTAAVITVATTTGAQQTAEQVGMNPTFINWTPATVANNVTNTGTKTPVTMSTTAANSPPASQNYTAGANPINLHVNGATTSPPTINRNYVALNLNKTATLHAYGR